MAEDAEAAETSLTDALRTVQGETVLVVEDETALGDLVIDVLEELGFGRFRPRTARAACRCERDAGLV